MLGGRPVIGHWGGDPGVFTAAYVEPSTRTGICLFINTSATKAAREAMRAIAGRLLSSSDEHDR